MLITVTLIGPDEVRSFVRISDDATVRDVATFQYDLFWRTLEKNGSSVPFTSRVTEGDIVSVEDERVDGHRFDDGLGSAILRLGAVAVVSALCLFSHWPRALRE